MLPFASGRTGPRKPSAPHGESLSNHGLSKPHRRRRRPERLSARSGRRLLPLDGHGQGRDGQFRPHVATHRKAGDFANEEIEHGGQIEPPILGWQAGDAGRPKPD